MGNFQVELEDVRTGLAKLQEETQDLELQKGALQVEGDRERIMIMERVESLSQRYLGGLEEVKADVFNVKFHCRDRIQEFENQWNEFRKQKPEGSNFASKQVIKKHHTKPQHFKLRFVHFQSVPRYIIICAFLELKHSS